MGATTWTPEIPQISRGGDVGGDIQIGESWQLRFWNDTVPDGVIDVFIYVIDHALKTFPPEGPSEFGLQVQSEFTVCRDRTRPGDTEEWSDATYDDLPERYPGPQTAEVAARKLAAQYAAWKEPANWDGEPWHDYRNRPREAAR
jgi:hypothetical protein